MRRIQLYVDDDVDAALSTEAARRGTTRSALVREAVRVCLADRLDPSADPLDDLIGSLDVAPDRDLDAVIYGTGD